MLKDAAPDIIVITGDMIDSRNTKVDVALDFAEQAVNIRCLILRVCPDPMGFMKKFHDHLNSTILFSTRA